jgi:hypothetical protein
MQPCSPPRFRLSSGRDNRRKISVLSASPAAYERTRSQQAAVLTQRARFGPSAGLR